MDEDATWYRSRPPCRPHCIRRVPSAPRKAHSIPLLGPCLLWPWSPISATAQLLLQVLGTHWNTLYPHCIRNIHAVNGRGYTVPGRNQSTRHTVNSSHRKMVWWVDRRVWRRCDELTVLFDLALVAFKRATPSSVPSILHTLQWLAMLYMYVQRLVSFKFPRPQVTNHPCYDSVTLYPNHQTELNGIAVALLCDELTGDKLTVWRDDRVTSWLVAVPGTHWNTLRHCFQLVPGIYMCLTLHIIQTCSHLFWKKTYINNRNVESTERCRNCCSNLHRELLENVNYATNCKISTTNLLYLLTKQT